MPSNKEKLLALDEIEKIYRDNLFLKGTYFCTLEKVKLSITQASLIIKKGGKIKCCIAGANCIAAALHPDISYSCWEAVTKDLNSRSKYKTIVTLNDKEGKRSTLALLGQYRKELQKGT